MVVRNLFFFLSSRNSLFCRDCGALRSYIGTKIYTCFSTMTRYCWTSSSSTFYSSYYDVLCCFFFFIFLILCSILSVVLLIKCVHWSKLSFATFHQFLYYYLFLELRNVMSLCHSTVWHSSQSILRFFCLRFEHDVL